MNVCSVLPGHEAFLLQAQFIKPFPLPGPAGSPQQAFNYRLSSAKRVVENAFAQLKPHFQMEHKTLNGTQTMSIVLFGPPECCTTFVSSSETTAIQAGMMQSAMTIKGVLSQSVQVTEDSHSGWQSGTEELLRAGRGSPGPRVPAPSVEERVLVVLLQCVKWKSKTGQCKKTAAFVCLAYNHTTLFKFVSWFNGRR